MRFEMSKLPGTQGRWVRGPHPDAVFTCVVDSGSFKAATNAAKHQRQRAARGLTPQLRPAGIDPSWQYCLPDSNVPYGLQAGKALDTLFYASKMACPHHPLNHVRYTSTSQCPICVVEYRKGILGATHEQDQETDQSPAP